VDPHEETRANAGPPDERREASRARTVDDDGERSLIRWMLSLPPAERLEVLQRQVEAILALRTGT